MTDKKAQGLSMSTIVIAALSLLVLVVLVLIFTGRMGLFSGGVEESGKCLTYCDSLGQTAISIGDDENGKIACRDANGNVIPAITGSEPNTICCCIS